MRPLQRILFVSALLFPSIVVDADELAPVWKYPPEMPGSTVVVYKTVEETSLMAWMFRPEDWKSTDSRPAIVFFFGGGWRGGTPGQFYPQCRYLAERGMVAITVDYRVKNRHKVLAPACVSDAKSAIRWLRKNAGKLGVNPDKIIASGGSAGGHLAACVAIVPGFDDPNDDLSISAVPNALALYNPAVILGKIEGRQQLAAEKIIDIGLRTGNKSTELSPFTHVRKDLPPTIIFHGTNDEAVPFWTVEKFHQAMTAKQNRCELKSYTGAPHGFFNTGRGGNAERKDLERQRLASTTVQLDRFLQSLGYLKGAATITASANPNIHLRGSLQNSLAMFRDKKTAHVAFMGGSITQMEGYRPIICDWLKAKFPETKFTFTNAGISSTCSTSGAFRLKDHVLQKGKLDLFFVEFAVNDDQDAMHFERECIRGMEGIFRQVREAQPEADIVMVHFINPRIQSLIDEGKTSSSISGHEKVARYYQVPTVHLAKEVCDRIKAKELTWAAYGGTHPKLPGNTLCADMVKQLLMDAWSAAPSTTIDPRAHSFPANLLDERSYVRGAFLEKGIKLSEGWKHDVPQWKSLKGGFRSQFSGMACYHNTVPGDELSIVFNGQALGAYLLAGPDAGRLEVSIDDGPFTQVELYHRHSRGLHYPRTVMFATNLKRGEHRARVRIAKSKHKNSIGTAARVLEFVVN